MKAEDCLTLNDKVLLAALVISNGDINRKFTAEELLIKSWDLDENAFGLRGYESKHPDSNNLYTKLMGKSGLVRVGYLKKIGDKTYTLTEAGLSVASSLKPTNVETQLKVDRYLHDAIVKIINHQIFRDWLDDKNKPKNFRDAMWFWGIAPGTPPKIARERLNVLERNLDEAKKRAETMGGKIALNSRDVSKDSKTSLMKVGSSEVDERKGRMFLDILDINRCIEFNNAIKKRFEKDLEMMLKED